MKDNVNHPEHYTGKIECIDAMIEAFGDVPVSIFCQINAFKYLWRAKKKGHYLEDLKKAQWYINKCVELIDND